MSEYQINTTRENRDDTIRRIEHVGTVTEQWPDGSFNFECDDNECEDAMRDILDELEIEAELL